MIICETIWQKRRLVNAHNVLRQVETYAAGVPIVVSWLVNLLTHSFIVCHTFNDIFDRAHYSLKVFMQIVLFISNETFFVFFYFCF